MSKTENIMLLLTAIVAVTCFLPWVSLENEKNWTGMEYSWGKATFACALFLLGVIAINHAQSIGHYRQLLLFGAIAMAICALCFFLECESTLFRGYVRWRGKYKYTTIVYLITAACCGAAVYYAFQISGGKSGRARRR